MGAVNFSLDIALLEAVKTQLPLDAFVETGTFKGDTIASVERHFSEVYSIELSSELYALAKKRFHLQPKIHLVQGNSLERLKEIAAKCSDKSTLFWLDAHWCVASDTAGEKSQCPLLGELKAIKRLNQNSIVLIDDARLFLAPPASPHEISDWPSIDAIIHHLKMLSDEHELMIVNDVIAFFPRRIRESFVSYAQAYGIDWLDAVHWQRQSSDIQNKEQVIQTLSAYQKYAEKEILQLTQFRDYYNSLPLLAHYYVRAKIIAKSHLGYRFNYLYEIARPRLGQLVQYEGQPCTPQRLPRPRLSERPPKISIVTPSYGQGNFIERTILSVLDQQYSNLEYYIQDGGSKDGTIEILERYAGRLDGWVSEKDGGQSEAINRGFTKTTGEIMGWLNSDDLLLPNTLALVADYFERHPDVDVVYGDRLLIDESDQEIGTWIMPGHDSNVLSWADYIPQETMFWRRRIWDNVGGSVDESFRFAMDWDLIMRFRDAGAKFAHIPDFLGAFRIHDAQKTSANINEIGHLEMDRLRQRALGRVPTAREIRRAVLPFLIRHKFTHLIRRKFRKT